MGCVCLKMYVEDYLTCRLKQGTPLAANIKVIRTVDEYLGGPRNVVTRTILNDRLNDCVIVCAFTNVSLENLYAYWNA